MRLLFLMELSLFAALQLTCKEFSETDTGNQDTDGSQFLSSQYRKEDGHSDAHANHADAVHAEVFLFLLILL